MLIRSQAKPAAISVIHACATGLPQVHAAPTRAQVLLAAEGMRRRSRAARTVAGRCGSL